MKFGIGPEIRLGTLLSRLGTFLFQIKKLSPRVEGWDLVESGDCTDSELIQEGLH